MKTSSEYLEQALKYDLLALQATKERRRAEYERLAAVYRYFAEAAAAMNQPPEVSPCKGVGHAAQRL